MPKFTEITLKKLAREFTKQLPVPAATITEERFKALEKLFHQRNESKYNEAKEILKDSGEVGKTQVDILNEKIEKDRLKRQNRKPGGLDSNSVVSQTHPAAASLGEPANSVNSPEKAGISKDSGRSH